MRPFGKALTALAAAGATLIPTAFMPAKAAHLEAGVGYSWGRVVADGTWRQSGNPYTMHTNDLTWYVGVGGHPPVVARVARGLCEPRHLWGKLMGHDRLCPLGAELHRA